MTIYIAHSFIGVLAANESKKPIGFVHFKNSAEKRATAFEACEKRTVSDCEKDLISKINTKEEIVFETKKDTYIHEFPNPAGEYMRANLLELAKKHNIARTKQELNNLVHATAIELTVREMRTAIGEDKLVLQVINTTDELSKQINAMSMRLREWYGYYFPELVEKLKSNEQLAQYVSETLYRTSVKGIEPEDSMGANIKKEDLEEIRKYAKNIEVLLKEKQELEKYVEKKSREVAPNMTEIVGGMLVARYIAHAGSLKRLACFPSSTIQILGAEKALFRYLKGSGTSPKHGILFQSSFIQRAPKQSRGKIARTLASKLSLAAKMDYYKHVGDVGKKYRQDIETTLKKEMAKKGKTTDKSKSGNSKNAKHFGASKNTNAFFKHGKNRGNANVRNLGPGFRHKKRKK
ncbi:MAG: hypothetical protein DRO96_02585 [Candidatus Aenigmatarchaeota archaeon]|nr:MAG: hypothetical protein DRO96_02585 [Candidatus Aenigmarchaeota archaeon]